MKKLVTLTSVLVLLSLVTALGCAPAPAAPTAKPSAPSAAPTSAPAAPAATTPAAPTATPAPKVKRGGILTVVSDFTIPTLDTHVASQSGGSAVMLIFDSLLRYPLVDEKAGKFALKPSLAESWKIVDPTTIDLTLRKGVKFHDGSDWNADVAKWNLDRMMNHPKSLRKTQLIDIASVEATGDYGIRLKLKAPSATVLMQLSGGGYAVPAMHSKKATEAMGEEQFGNNPVGTGPMKFDKWVRDDRITVKKFDGYWDKGVDGQPLPYLDGLVERYIPDKAVAMLELRAKNVDLVHMIEPKDVAAAKSIPGLVYWEQPWGSMYYNIFFNPKNDNYAKNQKLREAAWHAIDRDGLIKALGFGVAQPYYYPYWTPAVLGYDKSLPYYSYDLAKAKQLMAEAGYPNGLDVGLTVIQRSVEVRMSEAIKSMFDAIGLRTTISVLERLAWISSIKAFQFDLGMNRPSDRGDPDFQSAELTCDGGSNWASYCNPKMDQCLAEGRSEYDEAKRAEIYKRCQRILYEDTYFGTTFYLPGNVVYWDKVKGLDVQVSSYRVDARAAWID
ncbi:MAG: ABC transporter substrate-binding protein [Chloroflexi bacterium]|nr:ABC transporter substrate-binding protein [Chloroflexota bacterium]MCL5026938.1 ABC transporter substrate-binding protein [Chloroflexota bacterium]